MNRSLSNSSAYTYQAKANRLKTQASEFYTTSKAVDSNRTNPENSTYIKIAISRNDISLGRGYLDMQRRHK
jgi:hypothetical protein